MSRTILITGADGGIGLACAEWFEARGDVVIGFDRARGQDACNPDHVREVLASVPRLDGLVHAAGSVGVGGIEDCSVAEWRRVMDDNVTSAFVVCQAAIPKLVRQGSIVLLSSINGRHGGNRLSGPAYGTAKAALIGLTRHLAKDLGPRGIRVNAVAPGPVATPMLARLSEAELEPLRRAMPLGAIIEPSEIAGAIGFLCSADAVSMTGTVMDMNGGAWMG